MTDQPNDDIDWDSFGSGQFVKFENIGDSVTGTITRVYTGTDFNGNPCPVLDLTTPEGEERTLSCGQANLKAQMRELRPRVTDTITVTFNRTEKAEKGLRKVFVIEHTEGVPF